MGSLGGASGKQPTCPCRRHKRRGFDPWVGNIPRRRAWQPNPILLPGESRGQRKLKPGVAMLIGRGFEGSGIFGRGLISSCSPGPACNPRKGLGSC